MITKFNLFENQGFGQRYWKVLIDDYFFVRLEKIGMPEEIQKEIYEHLIYIQQDNNDKDYRFVMVGDYGGEMSDWHWNFNQNKTDEDSFYTDTDGTYEYQGVVEVTKDEIDDWKLKNDAKKYNL